MNWKDLIGNNEARELYDLTKLAHSNRATNEEKQRIIVLADLLNNEGYDDESIEKYIDWLETNEKLGNNISNC